MNMPILARNEGLVKVSQRNESKEVTTTSLKVAEFFNKRHTGEQMKHGKPLLYSGNELRKTVSYVLSGYGLQDGWVILGITS